MSAARQSGGLVGPGMPFRLKVVLRAGLETGRAAERRPFSFAPEPGSRQAGIR